MAQRDPARFDLQAALQRSLQPVDLRDFQKRNVNRVRLLKTEDLKGSVRDAIDRALTGKMDELRQLRERETKLSAEVSALQAKLHEESSRRQIAESALAAAQAAPAPAPADTAEIEQLRAEAKNALEEVADLRATLESAQEDAALGREELVRVQEQLDHMRAEMERCQTELEEARARLGEALVERERMRIELDTEMTRELPAVPGVRGVPGDDVPPPPPVGERTAVAALSSLGLVATPAHVEEPAIPEAQPVAEAQPVSEVPTDDTLVSHGSEDSGATEVLYVVEPDDDEPDEPEEAPPQPAPAPKAKPAPKVAFFGFGPALSTGGGLGSTWRKKREDEGRN